MALKDLHLNLSDITAANIEKHIETLRKAYEKINKDLNEISMVLFSGKAVKDAMICSGHCPSKEIENSGCLYTGDVNLKQPDILTLTLGHPKLFSKNFHRRVGR
jgi:hypothetical protein